MLSDLRSRVSVHRFCRTFKDLPTNLLTNPIDLPTYLPTYLSYRPIYLSYRPPSKLTNLPTHSSGLSTCSTDLPTHNQLELASHTREGLLHSSRHFCLYLQRYHSRSWYTQGVSTLYAFANLCISMCTCVSL